MMDFDIQSQISDLFLSSFFFHMKFNIEHLIASHFEKCHIKFHKGK